MAETIVESENAETVKFYWKVSSERDGDYLQFYIDETLKDQIRGEVDWQQIAYKHDVLGRRVEKKVDGYSTRYVYDGPT